MIKRLRKKIQKLKDDYKGTKFDEDYNEYENLNECNCEYICAELMTLPLSEYTNDDRRLAERCKCFD